MVEGRDNGGVVDGCALQEQRNWSRWSRVPEPLSAFDVSTSWHGDGELRRWVILWGSRFLLVCICVHNFLHVDIEVRSFYPGSPEVVDPFVKDPVPWVSR